MDSSAPIGRRSLLAAVGAVATLGLHGGTRSGRATPEPDGSGASIEGRYPATVDRIVDGDHVVLLVEARGEVVAQYDVARTTLPAVWEGDRLLVTVEDAALTAVRTEGGTRRRIDRVRPTATAW